MERIEIEVEPEYMGSKVRLEVGKIYYGTHDIRNDVWLVNQPYKVLREVTAQHFIDQVKSRQATSAIVETSIAECVAFYQYHTD